MRFSLNPVDHFTSADLLQEITSVTIIERQWIQVISRTHEIFASVSISAFEIAFSSPKHVQLHAQKLALKLFEFSRMDKMTRHNNLEKSSSLLMGIEKIDLLSKAKPGKF